MEENDDARRGSERASRDPLFRGYPPLADYPVKPATDEPVKRPWVWAPLFDFSQQSNVPALALGVICGILLLLIAVILCL